MATYTDRMNNVEDVSFEEASAAVKNDVRRQLIKVYFKDEPEFVNIMQDDEAYDKIYGEVLSERNIDIFLLNLLIFLRIVQDSVYLL